MIKWDEHDPNGLWLLTLDQYKQLPDGTKIESISGEHSTKPGTGQTGIDIQSGYLAQGNASYLVWGVRDPHNHDQKHLLMTFLLRKPR
jgi:hypothetical protein